MSTRKKPPLLLLGGLTRSVFVTTRWSALESGGIEAHEKYEVTDQFETIARSLGWTPPEKK